MRYCVYYQAQIKKKETWYFTAILKSFEHLVFDRTINKETGLFEFFVPKDQEDFFVKLMAYFVQCGIAQNVKKLENRLRKDCL